jgi:hypothetical protein
MTAENPSIEGTFTYIVDDGIAPVHHISGPEHEARTQAGTYEERTIKVLNGRHKRDAFSLETHGFEFLDNTSAVTDFQNPDEVRAVYYTEIEALIQSHTGASRVLMFDHTIRISDDNLRQEKLARAPVRSVHNDYTDKSGLQRVRDLLEPDEANAALKGRFAIVQVWRPITEVLLRDPLAICDARTLPKEGFIVVERHYPHRIGETYHITYNPALEWYYFPEIKRTEALIFRVFDSDLDSPVRYTAHSAFEDPTGPANALPRQSIEARALVFFD